MQLVAMLDGLNRYRFGGNAELIGGVGECAERGGGTAGGGRGSGWRPDAGGGGQREAGGVTPGGWALRAGSQCSRPLVFSGVGA